MDSRCSPCRATEDVLLIAFLLCMLQVIRESSGDNNNNSVGAPPQLQIPPPRPKRRPTHPYPRKLGNSVGKDASAAIKQLRKPQWQAQSLSEQENCSPKSVLTTAQMCSEALPAEGSGSPASSVHMEDKCLTPNTSVGESSVQVALSTVLNIHSYLKSICSSILNNSRWHGTEKNSFPLIKQHLMPQFVTPKL